MANLSSVVSYQRIHEVVITSPIAKVMGGYVFARVGRYIGICLWTTSWRQFKSDCHQTSSVIFLATGDEVITFWKVKVGGEVCALLNALSSCCTCMFTHSFCGFH